MSQPHDSPLVRHLLFAAGVVLLLLAIVGFIMPVLPGIPFLALAVACFSRSSERMHRWVLAIPLVGGMLERWEKSGSLPMPVKILITLVMIGLTAIPMMSDDFEAIWKWLAALVFVVMMLFVWTRSSRPN